MAKDFAGKSVIVTGSSSGIGEAIAILFAKRGAMVTLHGRDQERLQAALEKCQKAGGDGDKKRYIAIPGDIKMKEIQDKLVDETVRQFGRLDVLVCNHGTLEKTFLISDETDATYDNVMNTNLKSVYFLIQKAVEPLTKTKGNIISVSSIASKMAAITPAPYAMSKAAIDHMTRCLALELAPKGIRINTINPTVVLTRIFRHVGPEALSNYEAVGRAHPLEGRACTSEEQADVVAFLASDAASFVTGQCVIVDGAVSLRGAALPKDQL